MTDEGFIFDDVIVNMYFIVLDYTREQTNIRQYVKANEESQRKWREKLTIMICKKYAPRRLYDISKNEIRDMVTDVLDLLTELKQEE